MRWCECLAIGFVWIGQVRLGALKHLAEFLQVLSPLTRRAYLPQLESFKEVRGHVPIIDQFKAPCCLVVGGTFGLIGVCVYCAAFI